MNYKLLNALGFSLFLILCTNANAQLSINNAIITIESGAVVTVQGNITSNTSITGGGKILMKGNAGQTVSMGGSTISNLEIDNANNVTLISDLTVSSSLAFTNGKFQLGNNNMNLAAAATVTGMGTNKFIETNGNGYARRLINADVANLVIPVGTGSDYTPVAVTNSGSTYTSASIGVQAKGTADPNKHPRSESYLTVYWPIAKAGIAGGTTSATGTYTDPTRVTGTEADLNGMFWNGSNWSNAGTSQNTTTNTAGAVVSANDGELYAMNSFVLVSPKVFLQGAYNTSTLRMNDRLRNSGAYNPGTLPASNLIPTSDPYRAAPYNYTHTNNAVAENVISASFANPFIDQQNADNNIVDWVYLELRSATTPGNTILQTRSALLQRDGDIVDIDGVSPVYFKNVTVGGSYTLAIRHRNHLAISTNPANYTKVLGMTSSSVDMSTLGAANLMGAANTNYFNDGALNMMYAGNANGNSNIRWAAPSSDKDFILSSILGNSSSTVLSNVYSQGDVDLNRGVRWAAPNSDKDFILSRPLGNNAANVKSQVLPN
ncbi:MAG: hypothetical protein JST81_04040 [Bacteroidetes bacterium]|nr:hypothetical protein [Bacteroidota bacterium]